MLDIKSLSQVPIQVVRFRQNDDLECAVCLEYGPIVIIGIQECTISATPAHQQLEFLRWTHEHRKINEGSLCSELAALRQAGAEHRHALATS